MAAQQAAWVMTRPADDLVLLTLPGIGHVLFTVQQAKNFAEALVRVATADPTDRTELDLMLKQILADAEAGGAE